MLARSASEVVDVELRALLYNVVLYAHARTLPTTLLCSQPTVVLLMNSRNTPIFVALQQSLRSKDHVLTIRTLQQLLREDLREEKESALAHMSILSSFSITQRCNSNVSPFVIPVHRRTFVATLKLY